MSLTFIFKWEKYVWKRLFLITRYHTNGQIFEITSYCNISYALCLFSGKTRYKAPNFYWKFKINLKCISFSLGTAFFFVVAGLIYLKIRNRLWVGWVEKLIKSIDNSRDGKRPAPLSAIYLRLKTWRRWTSDRLFSWRWGTVKFSSGNCSSVRRAR